MEIDDGLAPGAVVGHVTTHLCGLWSHSRVVALPTTASGAKLWSISTITFLPYLKMLCKWMSD